MNDQFLLKIQAMLETSGIKTDYNKLKQMLEKDPAKINAVMDMSATKTEINKFIKEIAPELQKVFNNQGVKVGLKELESSLKSVYNTAQKEAKLASATNIKMQKDEIEAYNINSKIKESAINKEILNQKKLYVAHEQAIAINKKKTDMEVMLSSLSTQSYNKIGNYIRENTKLTNEEISSLRKLQNELKNVSTKSELTAINNKYGEIVSKAKLMGHTGVTLFEKFKSDIGNFLTFVTAGGAVMSVINSLREMVLNVKELDSQLLELSKVSDLSSDGLKAVTEEAYKLGEVVGKTGTQVLSAITSFKRAGYELKESMSLAEDALKLTNVAEGIKDAGVAAENLVHIIKGFGEDSTFSTKILDVINEVSNTQAIDFDNLVDGAERLSAVANQSDLSFEQMIGTLTGGYEVLGNMEKVSSGLITIFSRLRATQLEGEEEVSGISKLQDIFSKATKGTVNIVDQTTGKLRNTYDVLKELNSIWDTLDKNTQEALAFEAGGIRQKSVFLSIMQNWENVEQSVESASNSFGSADIENQKYLDSLEGRLSGFKSQYQQLSQEVVSGDFLKVMVSSGTDALSVLTDLIDKLGLFPTLLTAISTGLSFKNVGVFSTTGNGGITNIFTSLVKNAKLAETSINSVSAKIAGYNNYVKDNAVVLDKLNKVNANDSMTAYLQSLKGGEATLKGYNASLKAVTASSIGAKVATIALNTALTLGASILISSVFKAIDDYSHRLENAITKADELKESFSSSVSGITDNLSMLQSLSSEYKNLASGVDKYGNNISLTTAEYKRYNEILNKIIDVNHSIISGYNNEGEAIIDKNTALAETIELLEEERRLELNKALSTDSLTTIGEGAYAKKTKLEGSNYVGQYGEPDLKTVSGQATRFGKEAAKLFNEETIKAFYEYTNSRPQKKMYGSNVLQFLGLEESDLDIESFLSSNIDVFADNMNSIIEAANIPDDEIEKLKTFISEWNTLNKELSSVDSAYIDEYMQKIPLLTEKYDSLTDPNIKNFVSEFIRNSFSALDLKTDAIGVKTEILSLIDSISDDKDLQESINKLFSLDSSSISATDYVKQVDDLIKQIADSLNIDPVVLKINLGLDDDNTQALIDNVKAKFSNPNTGLAGISPALDSGTAVSDYIDSLSIEDLQILAKIKIDENATVDEIQNAIDKAKDQVKSSDIIKLEAQNKEIDNFQSSLSTLSDALAKVNSGEMTDSGIVDLLQQFPDLEGRTDDLSTALQELIQNQLETLLELLGDDAPVELVNYLKNMATQAQNTAKSFKDWQNQLSSAKGNIEGLKSLLNEINGKGFKGFSDGSLDKIISDYPTLLQYIGDEKSLREELNSLIGQQEDKANEAFMHMVQDSEVYYSNLKAKEGDKLAYANSVINGIIQGNSLLVDQLGKAYKVDLTNFKSITEAKAALEEEVIKNSAKAWSEYYKVQVDASTGMASASKTKSVTAPSDGNWGSAVDEYVEQGKAASAAAKAYNEAISRLNGIVASTNISTSTATKSAGGGKSTKDTKEIIDWIARKIDVLTSKIANLKKLATDVYSTSSNQNKQLDLAIKYTKKLVSIQEKYYKSAMKQANNVKLSDSLKKKVREGSMDITQYSGDTAEKIKEYQKWYDAAQEVKDKIIDLKNEERELAKQRIDNIIDDYEKKVALYDSNISKRESKISIANAKGGKASASDYSYLIAESKKQSSALSAEYKKVNAEFQKLIKNGTIKKGNDDWYEYSQKLADIKAKMDEVTEATINYQNEAQRLKWDNFDDKVGAIDTTLSEIDQLIKGTKEGSDARNLLLREGFEKAQEKSAKLRKEIDALNKQYAKDKNNTIYKERLSELTSELYSAVDAMQSYNDALVKSIKIRFDDQIEGLEKERDAWEELINAQKKALQQEKKNHDYQKSIAEKTENISNVEARIAELEKAAKTGDRNALKEKKELEDDLADHKEDLEEAQYDHSIELQEDALDKALEDYNKAHQAKVDAIKSLYDKEQELIRQTANLTTEEFKKAFDEINAYAEANNLTVSAELKDALNNKNSSSSNPFAADVGIIGLRNKAFASHADSSENILHKKVEDLLKKSAGKGGDNGVLNKYVRSIGYRPLSFDNMNDLGSVLGVKGEKVTTTSKNGLSMTTTGFQSASAQKKLLDALKKAGFSDGGTIGSYDSNSEISKLIKMSGEDVLVPAKTGEGVLTNTQNQAWLKLVPQLVNLSNMLPNINIPNLSNVTTNNSSPVINMQITIEGNADSSTVSQLKSTGNDIVNQLYNVMRKS